MLRQIAAAHDVQLAGKTPSLYLCHDVDLVLAE